MHRRALVDLQPEIRERDARSQRVSVERRLVDRLGPVRFRRLNAFGVTVVENRMIELTDPARGVVRLDRSDESRFI